MCISIFCFHFSLSIYIYIYICVYVGVSVWSFIFSSIYLSIYLSNVHIAALWGYGCSPENLLEAMNDMEGCRERVRDIRADGTTRWWSIYLSIYLSPACFYVYLSECDHLSLDFSLFLSLSSSFFFLSALSTCTYHKRTHAYTRGVRSPNDCPGNYTRPSDCEALDRELSRRWSTTLLPLLLHPLWPGVVGPVTVPVYESNRNSFWFKFGFIAYQPLLVIYAKSCFCKLNIWFVKTFCRYKVKWTNSSISNNSI